MGTQETYLFDIALDVLIGVITLSLLLCFVRLYRGPNVPNRTAAFDAIALHSVAIIVLFAMRSSSTSLLDVAIVTAVLGFLGTTMMAQYLERAAGRGWLASDGAPRQSTSARVAAEVAEQDEEDSNRVLPAKRDV
ncbi:MAG: monovalent cation/H+ antiporter complex subunit F [Litorilinea sp.]